MAVTNWTKFFKEEKDIYVQNVSGTIISLEFFDGDRSVSVSLNPTPDPINLAERVPFGLVKNSEGFRRLLNRSPAVLVLLTQEEYEAYYNNLAETLNVSVDEAIAHGSMAATEKPRGEKQATPTTKPQQIDDRISPNERARLSREAARAPANDQFVSEEDVINPRLLHVKQQFVRDSGETDEDVLRRYSPQKCLQDILSSGRLSEDDLNFILANVPYKTVKDFANNQLLMRQGSEEIDDRQPREPVSATP